jgi:hypothetical protein
MAQPPAFWSHLNIQPKRSYRFIVPFPIYVPKKDLTNTRALTDSSRTSIAELVTSANGTGDPGMLALGLYGENNIFDHLAVSCTKPSLKTEVYKTSPGGATSHPIVRPDQATTWEFAPVKIELLDTYGYDLASSLTAYLYAYGNITDTSNKEQYANNTADFIKGQFTPGKLIEFSNCDKERTTVIYEALGGIPADHPLTRGRGQLQNNSDDRTPNQAQSDLEILKGRAIQCRKWILNNSYISSIDFGSYSYGNDDLSKVTIEIVYDTFDYEFVLHDSYLIDREPDPLSRQEIRRRGRLERKANMDSQLRGETGWKEGERFRQQSRDRQRRDVLATPRPQPPRPSTRQQKVGTGTPGNLGDPGAGLPGTPLG